MEAIHLTFADWLIIAVYFGFVLGIGFYLKKFTKNENDFFLAGRKNSAWVAGIAFLSANLGALELLGMTGNTYLYDAVLLQQQNQIDSRLSETPVR
jgi:SSS family solute:Na+ symporter